MHHLQLTARPPQSVEVQEKIKLKFRPSEIQAEILCLSKVSIFPSYGHILL